VANEEDGTAVEVVDTIGPADAPAVLLLYTGGTIGMPDGALVPLDLRDLAAHVPMAGPLPVRLTLAAFRTPIDSAGAHPAHWLAIADAIVEHSPGHVGTVVLHGTDTMAFTASALSFLLEGIERPIVVTGAQRPVTSVRSDGVQNLVTAIEVAASADPVVPEVTIFFGDVLLRGNRATKVHADAYRAFASPNDLPLGTAGVALDVERSRLRAPGEGPLRRRAGQGCAASSSRPTAPATGRANRGSSTVSPRPARTASWWS
jgi:L-asparaginase